MMLHEIRHATPHAAAHLRLTYADGSTVDIDFTSLIQQGGVYAPLADPAFFAQVRIGAGGRFIEWPNGLDFCADALWRQGHGIALDDEHEPVASSKAADV
jgi:hypothetical protein